MVLFVTHDTDSTEHTMIMITTVKMSLLFHKHSVTKSWVFFLKVLVI